MSKQKGMAVRVLSFRSLFGDQLLEFGHFLVIKRWPKPFGDTEYPFDDTHVSREDYCTPKSARPPKSARVRRRPEVHLGPRRRCRFRPAEMESEYV